MLPADFQWIPRGQYAGDELALTVGGRWVAQLMKKANGVDWYALLKIGPGLGDDLFRDCESRESGIAGVEAWALRNEDALRAGRHLYPQAEALDEE